MANPVARLVDLVTGRRPSSGEVLLGGLSLERWLSVAGDGKARPRGYTAAVQAVLAHLRGHSEQDTLTALRRYYPESASRMIVVTLNVVRKIVHEQARVFDGDGQRFDLVDDAGGVVDEAGPVAWQDVLDKAELVRKLREANRITRACRRSYVRVTPDVRRGGVRLSVFSPEAVYPQFVPDTDYDLDLARGVLLRLADTYGDDGNRVERWEFWSAGLDRDGTPAGEPENFHIERRGGGGVTKIVGESGGKNPYTRDDGTPFVPLVSLSDEDADAGYHLLPSEQLLSAARAVNAAWTDLQFIARKQGHGQPYSEQREGGVVDDWPGKVTLGPDEPVLVPRGRTLGVLNYGADLERLLAICQAFLREVTQLESLPPGSVLSEARSVASGVALEIERTPLTELRRDQVECYRRSVHDLLETIRLVHNATRASNDGRFLRVKPRWIEGALTAPQDPETVNRVSEQRVRLGLTSPARLLAEETGATLEETLALAAEIAGENRARVTASLADVAESLRPVATSTTTSGSAEDE